jgi:tetratricopeptide (TPR) repeat protein
VLREKKIKGIKPCTAKVPVAPPEVDPQHTNGETSDQSKEQSIRRDKIPMPQYYHKWDQFDAEDEVEKIDDAEIAKQRYEIEQKQAQKDRILDEMAWNGDGDRRRTSTARPRVKISVRAKGRRPAPIDLAKPKKEEANTLFAQGRFKEAMCAYSAALEYLEKYEPSGNGTGTEATDRADGAGEETEALELKVTLLANRAQALIKIEEWREAIVDCDEALRFQPDHHKAILRRGFALAKQKRWSAAARDLQRAVAKDPQDKKAAAELQMARRNLAEQAKEVRAHASAIICDTTRTPIMPTRRLMVKARRHGDDGAPSSVVSASSTAPKFPQPLPKGARGESSVQSDLEVTGTSASSQATIANGSTAGHNNASRRPYVPRSVRIRGRQPAPEELDSPAESASSSSIPSVNFYAFEAQWTRNRQKPRERASQLRKVGADALPALFRESLDAELVASIVSVLAFDLNAGTEGAVAFAASVLEALSRTLRFTASLEALSAQERATCEEVLVSLEAYPDQCVVDIVALRRAFEPVPLPRLEEDEEFDEDDAYMPDTGPSVSMLEPELMNKQEKGEDLRSPCEAPPPFVESSAYPLDLDGCD